MKKLWSKKQIERYFDLLKERYEYLDNPWQFLKRDAWIKYLIFIEIIGIATLLYMVGVWI